MASIEAEPGPLEGLVIAVFGPTSVGKSEVAVAISELLATEGHESVVIGADSMQIYAGLELLSGTASDDQRQRAEHRLLGAIPLQQQFSVAQYAALAHAEIDLAIAEGSTPIVVGGTGLYMQAALTDMPLRPPVSEETEADVARRLESEGELVLHAELAESSPSAAERIKPQDHRRLVRALALVKDGHNVDDRPGGIWTTRYRRPTRLFGLQRGRDALYERINSRVDVIAATGGPEEVAAALASGASRTAQMALGFKELQTGDLEAMKVNTRRYAKRQMTWLRRLDGAEVVDCTGQSAEQLARVILLSSRQGA